MAGMCAGFGLSRARAAAIITAVLVLALLPASASALAGGEVSPGPLGNSLALGGTAELLVPGGRQAAEAAWRQSPEAMSARWASQTRYEHFDRAQAIKLAASSFPRLTGDPIGGPPASLPQGARIVGYSTETTAQLALPGGKHGVIESVSPMAIATSRSTFAPLDLRPHEAAGAFQPTRGLLSMRIPKHLAAGLSIPALGVSLTPVSAAGKPLGGSEGALDNAGVLYANAQTDTDEIAKPTSNGFALDALMRADDSPQRLYYQVGLPAGAHLEGDGRGGARVVREGVSIADLPAPMATDAAGASVPVRLSIAGHTIVVDVERSSGEYQYPIYVDPNVYDTALPTKYSIDSNWHFEANSKSKFESYPSGETVVMAERGNFNAGEHDELIYEAHGESSVMYIEEESRGSVESPSGAVTALEFAHGGTQERVQILGNAGESYPRSMKRECVGNGTCGEGPINQGNEVRLQQTATLSSTEGYGFYDEMYSATVGTRQEKGPEPSFNTSEPNLASASGRENVLYGSNRWLTEHSGAFEIKTHDPGLGISHVSVNDDSASWKVTVPILSEGLCAGVWCNPNYNSPYTYSHELAEGDNTIEVCAEDATNMSACADATVKVDNTPPYAIKVSGMAEEGAELSASTHQIKVEATDGTSPTASSGIKSVEVLIDGKALGSAQGYCTPGPCTSGGEWTIDGETLGVGEHTMKVIASDNAGNVSTRELTFAIRNASPIALGPGKVDPITGQFTISASDASMTGVGGLTRTYTSQRSSTTPESPFGPQWSANVGTTQSISKLANGSVELTGGEGRLTIFARNAKGELESPAGDGNLKLTSGESEGKPVYYLADASTATTVKFVLPSGSRIWVPAQTEGATASGTTAYGYRTVEQPVEYALASASAPTGLAVGADGNLWVSQSGDNAVAKVTTAGKVAEYKLTSPFSCPNYIAAGPKQEGALWFTDDCDHQIGKITTSGATTAYNFTSGVELQGIVAGPDGNLWFAMEGVSKIGRITTSGTVTEYALPSGSRPYGIAAGPDGNLWFTDYGTSKVGKITTSGTVTEYALPSGSRPYGIAAGPDGNLWFTDYGTSKVGKITTSGTITEYALPSGSEPRAIAAGPGEALWFTDYGTSKVGKITTSGVVSEFALPEGSEPDAIAYGPDGNVWYTDYGTGKIGKLTPVTEPLEELGPVPSGVTCGKNPTEVKLEEMKPGCRALTFTYDEKMNVPGEAESEWGEYHGRLMTVSLTAYNPAASSKKMETVAIAQYAYDKQGRLRAEWDPRISPALKTIYGYDTEGHLSSLTPPGQEPWAFTYGTIPGNTEAGRLLKVTRAPASGELWKGEALKDTEAPKITGTPTAGGRLTVSNGSWSGNPVVYAYQWEDCAPGAECTPIAGATNANYTPTVAEIGHTLLAQVTATNSGGSALAASAATSAIVASSVTQSIDSGTSLNAVSCVASTTFCVLTDGKGNAFYANNVSTTAGASWSSWSGPGTSPSEAVDCPTSSLCLQADGSDSGYGGNLYYATAQGGSWTQAYSPSYGVDAISCSSSSFCLDGQDDYGYYRYSTSPASGSWTLESQGSAAIKGVSCLSSAFCAIVDGAGSVHVATSTSQVESSSWTPTDVDGSTAMNGIACTSTLSCVAVDAAGNVLNLGVGLSGEITTSKQNIDATNSLTAITCSGATCVSVDNQGNVFVSTNDGEGWSKKYTFGHALTSVSCASSSLCVTVDASGEAITFNPASGNVGEGEARSPQPGMTIEYRVPVSGTGSGAPNLSSGEVAKWAQTDDPSEATAILPPSKPMGWPATEYGAATIYYFDSQARAVNVATPGGGISTTEYNKTNDAVKSLSAQNRATALKEANTEKAAKLLSTEDKYNSEGTELLETLGPQHTVKLAHGRSKEDEEVLARHHVVNYYNEGAPAGETYRLLTKTISSAQAGSGEEFDKRETLSSYSGQGNLGWKLRKPTSVTVNPGGLKLTTTTVYNPSTGSPVETRSPGAGGPSPNVVFSRSLGSLGSGNGQLKNPWDIASNASGDLWVADTGNNRVEEFGPEGAFIRAVGTSGTGNGQFKEPEGIAVDSKGDVWVADTGNDRVQELSSEGTYIRQFGSAGSGTGQLSAPEGLSTDAKGDVWVADTGNDRVQEFSPEGVYMRTIGSGGTGEGQFEEPSDVSIDAEGNLYVLDHGNSRVQEFNAAGEYVRQFGSEGAGNGQLKAAYRMSVSPQGTVWVSDTSDDRVEEFSRSGAYVFQLGSRGSGNGEFKEVAGVAVVGASLYALDSADDRIEKFNFISDAFTTAFGSEGTGNGQLKNPWDMATDASGNIWVADTSNDRVEEFTPEGSFMKAFGSEGSGNGQFKSPEGIAVDSKGDVWVADTSNNRVQELSGEGTYMRQFGSSGSGNGQLKKPEGLAIDSKGDVWVADASNNRIEGFSPEGQYLRSVGTGEGTGSGQFKSPSDVAFNSEGDLYVLDKGNHRVQEFANLSSSAAPSFSSTFGSEGTGSGQLKNPWDMAVDSAGNVWVADTGNDRVEEFNSKGTFVRAFGSEGTGNGQFKSPEGIAVAGGDVWVADSGNDRIEEFTTEGTYVRQAGSAGTGNGQFKEPEGLAVDSKGDVWVADEGNSRVQELSPEGAYLKTLGSEGTGNGQFKAPADLGFNAEGDLYVLDHGNHRVQEFNASGEYLRQFGSEGSGNGQMKTAWRMSVGAEGNVWLADSSDSRVEEFSGSGEYLTQVGTEGTGNGQLKTSGGVDVLGSTLYVLDKGNDRVQEFSFLTGEYLRQFGSEGSESGQMKTAWRMSVGAEGNVWLADTSDNRIEEFTGTGAYVNQFGSEGTGGGQFKSPYSVALEGSTVYALDHSGDRVQAWSTTGTVRGESAHDVKTVYYSTAENPEDPTCGEHPEWSNLPCQTLPAAQPGGSLPELPSTTVAYNMLGEAEVTTEKFGEKPGATTRTMTETFDAAGRPLTSETASSSTEDHALPKVTNEYSETTGALVKQTTTEGERSESVTSVYNKLGQLQSYTDAAGNTAKYVYDEDGRLTEAKEGKGGEAESTQTYVYAPTSGALTESIYSQGAYVLKLTASYNVAGKLTSETYPNAMTANYTYNSVGEATALEYVKTADCKSTCNEVWYKDSVVPSIYGQPISQTSTLVGDLYSYDTDGRIVETQETPVGGKGCEVRLYAYDEESNRLSLTTRAPAAEGKCASSGGTVQSHTYDEANRLTDAGVTYDALDNITKLPASDAGKEEGELTSQFYVDNQVEKQSQNGETINYQYDPAGRTLETRSEGKTAASVISHYNGPGDAVTWTSEGPEQWTHNIVGIDGSLTAIQKSGQAPVLQLHDLQGDIVATAEASEAKPELLSTYDSTEFGVPTTSSPPKYAWLGASGVASELPSGVSSPGGASYVPQVARTLEVEQPIPPGAFPDGVGSGAPYVTSLSALAIESGNDAAANTLAAAIAARELAAAEAAAREAEEKAQEAAAEEGEEGGGEVGGAEDYDPEGLASYKETLKRAEQLEKDAVNSALLAYAASFIPDFGAYVSGGAEGLKELLISSAKSLGACSTAKAISGRKFEWGTCFINETRLGYKSFSIPIWAEAELCTYERTKKGVNEYNCLESGRKKVTGPWYNKKS